VKNDSVIYEWEPQPGAARIRLVLDGDDAAGAIRVERCNNDLFLMTPDSRIIAALVQVNQPAA